ncbi:MAG TPA: FAD:protein FMN transferase [Terracidiphilus sp.]|nr:FAD:protein FMN transferase [Terracidiphilus sp.]
MACRFEVIVEAENDHAVESAQRCLDEVDRLESILSIYRSASEATLLNLGAARHPVPVGPEMFELLELCATLQQETKGAFDITTGALSQCWGFQERKPSLPALAVLRDALSQTGFHRVTLRRNQTVSFSSLRVQINFGGIGKGYALDRGAVKLRERGIKTALLSAGHSSVLAVGAGPEGAGWLVGLRHPVQRERRLGTVRLSSCAMGTSGQEEQSFLENGRSYGHILDPKTGFPADRVLNVSVIADSVAHADALATAFCVSGPELATDYCGRHQGVIAVILMAENPSHPIVIGSNDRASVEVTHD